MRRIAGLCAALVLAGCASMGPAADFSPRLATPRVAPVPEGERTPEQVRMINGRNLNIYLTLARHPALYARWTPVGQFLLNGSSLPPRHRELLMLRMGWLCQSPYEWAQHVRIAMGPAIGVTAPEIHRIAEGPDAPGWTPFERALLRAVDEMRYEAMISDATWAALKTQYTDQQVMEALFTATQYQLVSMALNSAGVQVEPENTHRLPADLPRPAPASRPKGPRLSTPRLPPVPLTAMSPEQRRIVSAQVRPDGTLFNIYATMIHHPTFYGPRSTFGSYLQRDSLLPPRTRELLIMRTGWLLRAEYEWAHHTSYSRDAGLTDEEIARIARGPDAPGWNAADRAVLRAADELRREAFISDATWTELARTYDVQRMLEIIYTVGGYSMTAVALNSFGVQVEPGYPKLPS
jgi:4-carboxymuconolactone decarboxylase